MGVKFCPNCGSREIKFVAGGSVGLYECSDCGFRGAIFPEVELDKDVVKKRK